MHIEDFFTVYKEILQLLHEAFLVY